MLRPGASAPEAPATEVAPEVQEGVAAFVRPPPMETGRWAIVEFAAGPDRDRLRTQTEGQALTATTSIFVAQKMRVSLLPDPAFEIKAKGAAVQDTGLDRTATWLWDVRPKTGGAHSLKAKVEVLRALPDGQYEAIEEYTRKVDVTVRVGALESTLGAIDQGTQVGNKLTGMFNSWQKAVGALTALIVALGVLAWRLGLRRRKPAD